MISLPLNLPIIITIIVLKHALNNTVIIIIILILLYGHELSSIISKKILPLLVLISIICIYIYMVYIYIVYPDPMSKSMAQPGDTKEAPLPKPPWHSQATGQDATWIRCDENRSATSGSLDAARPRS